MHMFESGFGPDKAWHGLMTPVDGLQNAADGIRLAGLDWLVEKYPMIVRVPNGDGTTREVTVPKKWAQVRSSDGAILGTVGDIYTDVSNAKAFEWADALVGGFGAHYKTAGSLYGGKVVWMLLEVPFDIKTPDGQLRSKLYLRNSHDGTTQLTAGFTTVDIVCANTLAVAEATALDKVSIRHTANAEEKLAKAQETMHLVEGAAQRASELVERLWEQKIDSGEVERVLNAVYPLPDLSRDNDLSKGELRSLTIAENKRADVLAAYNNRPALAGTAWGLYEGFSAAYQHQDIDGVD